jgi:hypothetical protein
MVQLSPTAKNHTSHDRARSKSTKPADGDLPCKLAADCQEQKGRLNRNQDDFSGHYFLASFGCGLGFRLLECRDLDRISDGTTPAQLCPALQSDAGIAEGEKRKQQD